MRGFTVSQIPPGKPGAGIKVVTLHYSADPSMTPERVAALRAKYPDQSTWNREMEIDDRARSGQRIFNFDPTVHLVEGKLPIKREEWTVWQICDPHPRTPNAFLWLAANRLGELAVIWSWWKHETDDSGRKKKRTIDEYARMLRAHDSLLVKPYRRIMDPAGKSWDGEPQKDFFEAFRSAKEPKTGEKIGVAFTPAKKNFGYNGYALINQALKTHEFVVDDVLVKRPRLTIWRDCGDNNALAERLEMARWREWKQPVDDKDAPEEPEGKDMHLPDCLSYGMLDGPRFVEPYVVQRQNEQDHNTVIASARDILGDSSL